jgi:hypothetical protein
MCKNTYLQRAEVIASTEAIERMRETANKYMRDNNNQKKKRRN